MRGEGALADSSGVGGYEEFFDVAKRSLVSQALLFTGHVEDARDHLQEVLFRACREWDRISRYEDPQGWACRAPHNLSTDHWRRKRGRRLVQLTAESQVIRVPEVGHLDIVEARQACRGSSNALSCSMSRTRQATAVLWLVVELYGEVPKL
ncbi:MAG: sigma factor [Acidimicrobiales bacterium]